MQPGQESRSSSMPSCSALPSFLTIQEGQLWNLGSYKVQTTALFRQGVKPATMSNCWAQPLTPHNQKDWTVTLGNLRTQLWSNSTTEHSLQPHPIMEPRQNSSQPERQFLDPPICEIQREIAPTREASQQSCSISEHSQQPDQEAQPMAQPFRILKKKLPTKNAVFSNAVLQEWRRNRLSQTKKAEEIHHH